MNQFTTENVQTLAHKQDITEVVRAHLKIPVNTLLETERTEFLDDEKYDRIGFNSGNASYSRTFHTEYGNLNIQAP
ncbi:transposase [Jeotgalibacillus soli]|uniref:Transposase n=1 Tax=Jeotgalibacillus soli TaxID=889306 RepID=A0A0C2V525_9BACL|nr:transposase [Jeotgalibacillus soli]